MNDRKIIHIPSYRCLIGTLALLIVTNLSLAQSCEQNGDVTVTVTIIVSSCTSCTCQAIEENFEPEAEGAAASFCSNKQCPDPNQACCYENLFPTAPPCATTPSCTNGACSGSRSYTFNCYCKPLPIELVRFTGQSVNNTNALNWETATETENDRFEIEASPNADNWTMIGEVEGQGTSSTHHLYSFVDEEPIATVTYYRLKQIDFDGTSSYSSIISVSNRNLIGFESRILPNPSRGKIRVEFILESESEASYQIVNVAGLPILAGPIDSRLGLNRLEVDTHKLPSGVYFFVLLQDEKQITQKFVKN